MIRSIIYYTRFIVLSIVLFGTGYILLQKDNAPRVDPSLVKQTGKIVQAIQKELDFLMSEIPVENIPSSSFGELHELFEELLKDHPDVIVLVYLDKSLHYWSDNTLIKSKEVLSKPCEEFIRLSNAYYSREIKTEGQANIVLLSRIYNAYPYENEFLQNGFVERFSLPKYIQLEVNKGNKRAITGVSGEYLFSLGIKNGARPVNKSIYLSLALIVCSIMFYLFFLHDIVRARWILKTPLLAYLVVFAGVALLRLSLNIFDLASNFNELNLFKPKFYGVSRIFPSLGDLLLNTLFILFLVHELIKLPVSLKLNSRKISGWFYFFLLCLITGTFFLYSNFILESLIFNSSISFVAHRILDLSVFSFVGLFIIAINYIIFIYLLDQLVKTFKPKMAFRLFLAMYIAVSAILFTIAGITSHESGLLSVTFFFVSSFVLIYAGYFRKNLYQFTSISLLVILFAIFAVLKIDNSTSVKEVNQRKVLAINLSAEHDPVAELLLPELENKLRKDTSLGRMVLSENIDIDQIDQYIFKKYFKGYWSKYDFHVIICSAIDSLYLEPPDDELVLCYSFFEKMIQEEGIHLSGTNFYFLDNLNGSISYFGSINYIENMNSIPVTLFLELNSRPMTNALGYPELLLESSGRKQSLFDNYDYARYKEGILISANGDYDYHLELPSIFESGQEFQIVNHNGFEHLVYSLDEDNTMIISKPSTSLLDYLISFSYVFLFFYLFAGIVILLINKPISNRKLNLNFKDRIQLSLVFVLLLSLPAVGGGTLYFSVKQYKSKQHELITEKIHSVYIELVHKLEFEESLTPGWKTDKYDNLAELLIKFSNVFYTDINLFSNKGTLIASSRPEVFNKGLTGRKMNPGAYYQMHILKRSEYIQNEHIGDLKYLSGYVPFFNNKGELLAYLNLPYFTKQNDFRKEISTLVVAIVNIYVLLLILTLGIAIIVSNNLTRPLRHLQMKIKSIELGKTNEKIEYDTNDEIGSLVNEYNNKVDELAKNMELLAKTERESAWREMAKQIAHEIKNPLTPIKLSVQHMKRMYQNDKENYDKHLERFSDSIIEQIDNLSSIATAFSNFAKMRATKKEKVNLVAKIENLVNLFSNTNNCEIISEGNQDEVWVLADREQIMNVFVNIMKNAVQSIPDSRKGKITVRLKVENEKATVEIEDNGEGIPEEIRERLFQPNFTTKSSGSGLGLAIARKIVQDCDGDIYYYTQPGKGTKFRIELPVYKV